MPTKQKLIQKERLSVLVAPMDWGLGHATRCIPLVRALQNLGTDVIIAAEGAQLSLLKNEFPQLNFIHLKGYRIRYSSSKRLLPFKIVSQLPKILQTIRSEHEWLRKIKEERKIDIVISDNRYGLYHKDLLSVFITHQLRIQTPLKQLTRLAQRLNYKRIQHFDECWVPDFADRENNIAGNLSHPDKLPDTPVHYIGCLSRFEISEQPKKYDYTALISGPEPQRSLLEEKIRNAFAKLNGNKCIVLGKPDEQLKAQEKDTDIFSHLNANELQQLILSSDKIICRSGYSTIMDLIKLKRSALLIPTPGQTEQEYLAERLQQQGRFDTISQDDLSAETIISSAHTKTSDSFPAFDLTVFLQQFIQRHTSV